MKTTLATLLLAATALGGFPAAAQDVDPLAGRAADLPQVLTWLQNQGVKLTALGEDGGLRGYLGESANGRMQTFYVTPDGKSVVAGVMFETGGRNVTGVQIGEMRARFEAASKGIADQTLGDGAQAPAADAAPAVPANPAPAPGADDPTPAPAETAPAATAEAGGAFGGEAPVPAPVPVTEATAEAPVANAPEPVPAPAADAAPSVPPPGGPVAGAMGNEAEMWVSEMDKGKFLAAADKAPYFEVGSLSAKPVLWMVADPQCPFCHATWDKLRPLVFGKQLRVRVILIAGIKGSEPLAREILSRAVPARAWLDSDGGRNVERTTPQDSPEWAKSAGFLDANMALAEEFKIDRTPFLAYEGPDGRFYASLGQPGNLDGFLSASGAK